jgi:hypothetical protein
MPRKATGTVRILRNAHGERQWHGKWTHDDRTRSEWLPLPGRIALDDVEGAKACAAKLALVCESPGRTGRASRQ